tara:strand:+ start:3125 stop:3550 length:426 start_codon:yes stop_codon:yes gene_type:complete
MNLSNLSRQVIDQIGKTQGGMFFQRLTPIQIIILTVTREEEWQLSKRMRGKKRTSASDMLFASTIRKIIENLYTASNHSPYTTQGFWVAISQLKKSGLIYVAPHKRGTSKRTICLTPAGEALFCYPSSILLYTTLNQQQKP